MIGGNHPEGPMFRNRFGKYLHSVAVSQRMSQRPKSGELEASLERALSQTDDDEVRFHIRTALQLAAEE